MEYLGYLGLPFLVLWVSVLVLMLTVLILAGPYAIVRAIRKPRRHAPWCLTST